MRLIGRWDNTAMIIWGWCEELRRAITVSEAVRQADALRVERLKAARARLLKK